MIVQIHNGDAFKFVQTLEDESVDLVVTDPPYDSLETHREIGTTTRLKKSWFDVVDPSYFPPLMSEFYRILAPNSHCYILCNYASSSHLIASGKRAGFHYWKPIIWNKVHPGMGYHYRCTYEFILFFEKGKRKLNSLSVSDVITIPRVMTADHYPTEKPTSLLEVLINQSTNKNDVVLDCFFGSGSTLRACMNTGRNFIGSDLSLEAHSRIRLIAGTDLPEVNQTVCKHIHR